MSYQQLCQISGIHRNSLRERLDELTKERVVIKHKYQIPKNDLYYGITSQYSSLPDCRHHYLLNVWKDETKELLDLHYFLDQLDDAIDEIKAMIDKSEDQKERENLEARWRSLAIQIRHASSSSDYDRIKQIAQKPIDAPTRIDECIFEERRKREIDLALVPLRHRSDNYEDYVHQLKFLTDNCLDNLMEFADHLIRFNYSILDLIIRCCNGIIISTKNFNPHNEFAKFLLFPMVTYREMLSLLRSTKYATQLFQLFDVSIKC